ncbi:MAG: DUF167 family protein [Geminicoccaceae bacterium]
MDGIDLAVKATPRAAKAEIGGLAHDAAGAAWLSVRVTVPPDGGRANAAILALLAKELDVAPRACRLLSGATGRWKRVRVEGDPETLARRAAALAAGPARL